MSSYDATRYSPPAPLAQVALRHMNDNTTVIDVPLSDHEDKLSNFTALVERFASGARWTTRAT